MGIGTITHLVMYKHLEKLNVKLNLPNTQISQYTPKKFRSASEICKYDCSFEDLVLKELGGATEIKEKKNRKSISERNEEIMKSLSGLQEEDKRSTHSQRIEKVKVAPPPFHKDSETMLRMKAETAGETYLGLDDAGKFLRFLDYYVELMQKCQENVFSDEKVVKCFNLFDGNVKKSAEFLLVAEELEELGFDEEKVISALMLFSNDREAALQFLMKD